MDKGTATKTNNNIKKTNENFAELLEESFNKEAKKVGSLVKGQVVAIEKDSVVIDIGYKAEGRVPIKEFTPPDKKPEMGDEVEVYFENAEKVKLVLVGCVSLILMQTMIHIGVNIRLFPTTGMTLPFISYGGSSIISISILSGIILNLTKRKIH